MCFAKRLQPLRTFPKLAPYGSWSSPKLRLFSDPIRTSSMSCPDCQYHLSIQTEKFFVLLLKGFDGFSIGMTRSVSAYSTSLDDESSPTLPLRKRIA